MSMAPAHHAVNNHGNHHESAQTVQNLSASTCHTLRHPVGKVRHERVNGFREIVETCRELSRRAALVHVRVPSADVRKCHLEADIGFAQHGDDGLQFVTIFSGHADLLVLNPIEFFTKM